MFVYAFWYSANGSWLLALQRYVLYWDLSSCMCVYVCVVLCTSPNKYRVADADGTIKPRCCVDMLVTMSTVFTTVLYPLADNSDYDDDYDNDWCCLIVWMCFRFVRINHRAIAMMFVGPSVCLSACVSGMGMHCDYTVHFSTDMSLWLDSLMFWAPWHQSMSTNSQPSFSNSTWNRGGVWKCKLGVISQERLKIEVKLLMGSHIYHVDWHNNGWPWVTLNGCITYRTLSLR